MKTKKALSLTLAILMTAGALTACGGDTSSISDGAETSSFNSGRAITVVSREAGSGTRGAFIELFGIEETDADGNTADLTTQEAIIANKTDVMLTNVSSDTYAIGYVSLGSLSNNVKAVQIDGTDATAENIQNGTYKAARPFNIATKSEVSEVTQDFIDFILSSEGQEVVTDGYIPVDNAAPAYNGTMPSGKIVAAGSSSVSPIMEKLKEAYLAVNTNASIEIQTTDSTSGMNSTIEGTCDIGMASRDLKDSELNELTPIEIAIDGIAIVVNKANPVENLTSDSVRAIFTGEFETWSEAE